MYKTDGDIYTSYENEFNDILYQNGAAFAATKIDGSIDFWGSYYHGGSSISSHDTSAKQVTDVISSDAAFVSIFSDGTIDSFGNERYGGGEIQGAKAGALLIESTFEPCCVWFGVNEFSVYELKSYFGLPNMGSEGINKMNAQASCKANPPTEGPAFSCILQAHITKMVGDVLIGVKLNPISTVIFLTKKYLLVPITLLNIVIGIRIQTVVMKIAQHINHCVLKSSLVLSMIQIPILNQ